jgi:hypothetical protein
MPTVRSAVGFYKDLFKKDDKLCELQKKKMINCGRMRSSSFSASALQAGSLGRRRSRLVGVHARLPVSVYRCGAWTDE